MQTISASIIDIANQEPSIDCGEGVTKSLEICKTRTENLEKQINSGILDGVQRQSKRGWRSFKATLKDKTIQRIESQLRGDVMMLLVTLQPFFHHVQSQKLNTLSGRISQLSVPLVSHNDFDGMPEAYELPNVDANPFSEEKNNSEAPSKTIIHRNGRIELSRREHRRASIKIDIYAFLEKLSSVFGISLPPIWKVIQQRYAFGVTYTSVAFSNYNRSAYPEDALYSNIKRRLKVILPIASFQIQTSSIPWSLTSYPIAPCQSQIFTICADGNIDTVKPWFKNAWVSPFVVNQHGENLLHAAARYANADICSFLLDIGVDGSAYDDQLLTPLDHLARKVCTTFAFPARVVNTIRALVERGRCQPILPVTSNAVAFYRGPEEGFAWLFASEYEGSDLEAYDSEGWTLLNDAAFNFGWWTQLCCDDRAVSWQSIYLLRSGANSHARTLEGDLTPLDTFMRGCTAHSVDHATKWLQALGESGVDLHEYAREELRLHSPDHYLKSTWDDELWRWIPTRRRVIYKYGNTTSELAIWLEDYDALSWFQCGRHDLEIFGVLTAPESLQRWKEINARDDLLELDKGEAVNPIKPGHISRRMIIYSLLQTRSFQFLVISLLLNYLFHLYLVHLH
ncbi:hypothetical protein LAWI1_G008024 [Lachnellula willkommii]|uniref:Uncharacterized protein n=1 Tax=Lachnellula willkommii TaxID=215461 RepID=A0A559M2M7_9HELO|nr:hypothetical protein LAWI1_G008024 [Lachnellula willkommii]